jgi:hypothetical protein
MCSSCCPVFPQTDVMPALRAALLVRGRSRRLIADLSDRPRRRAPSWPRSAFVRLRLEIISPEQLGGVLEHASHLRASKRALTAYDSEHVAGGGT